MTARATFDPRKIRVINNHDEYGRIAAQLNRECTECNYVGLDCEWIQGNNPVALLQLATWCGNFYLIRTCKMGQIPSQLKQLLENQAIIKTGVNIGIDVTKLFNKYSVNTRGRLDLRYLAVECGNTGTLGMASLVQDYLGIEKTKVSEYFHYWWDDETLDDDHLKYAAKDAFYSVELFKEFVNRLTPGIIRNPPWPVNWRQILGEEFIDVQFRDKRSQRGENERTCRPAPRVVYQAPAPRMVQQGPGLGNGPNLEDDPNLEGGPGLGFALVAGAGLAALGGFLYYRANRRQD